MSAILDRLCYLINDAIGKKTYAETQKSKYREVIDQVTAELSKASLFDYVTEQQKIDYECMEKNSNAASGKMSTTFENKVDTNRTKATVEKSSLSMFLSITRTKLEEARSQYGYWCDEADREDREMKVYEQQYYAEQEAERRRQEEAARQRELERQRQEEERKKATVGQSAQ